jgi:hypothetical protein
MTGPTRAPRNRRGAELLAGCHSAVVFAYAHYRPVEGAHDFDPAAGAPSAHEAHVPPKVRVGSAVRQCSARAARV